MTLNIHPLSTNAIQHSAC